MKPLKESFIKAKDLDNIKKEVLTKININDLESGDIVQLRNKETGIIIFLDDISDENYYPGICIAKEGTILLDDDISDFSGLSLEHYSKNGKSPFLNIFDIIKTIKDFIPKDLYLNKHELSKFMKSGKMNKKFNEI